MLAGHRPSGPRPLLAQDLHDPGVGSTSGRPALLHHTRSGKERGGTGGLARPALCLPGSRGEDGDPEAGRLHLYPGSNTLEVTRDAQAWANNYFIQVDHPQWGPLTMPGFPWEFSETPASWRLPAPRLGEHTEEILAALGFAPDEITSLQKGKIIL